MTQMDSNLGERLVKFETFFTSKDPEVVSASAQLSFPPGASFGRMDFNPDVFGTDPEVKALKELLDHYDALNNFVPFLYTYRSLSATLTKADFWSGAQDGTCPELAVKYDSLYMQLFDERRKKMMDLLHASQEATEAICRIAGNFPRPTEVLLSRTVQLIEILFNLDEMRLRKSGVTGDLSAFRRILQSQRLGFEQSYVTELNKETGELQMFLATKYWCLGEIKRRVGGKDKENEHGPFFAALLAYCAQTYSAEFVLPKEKTALVTAIAAVFFVYGNIVRDKDKLFPKDVVLACSQIVEKNSLLPTFAEMSFQPGAVIAGSQMVPPKGVTFYPDPASIKDKSSDFALTTHLEEFREVFKQNLPKITKIARDGQVELKWLYDSIQSVTEMANAVMSQFAFKCTNPAPIPKKPEGDQKNEKVLNYDLQVRYNFSVPDLDALIEMIGNLKTMTNFALRGEPAVMNFVYVHVARQVQKFIQETLGTVLEAASKAGVEQAEAAIIAIRNAFGHWKTSTTPDKHAKAVADKCVVPPSIHQLDLIRLMAEQLVNPKNGPCADEKKGKLKSFMKSKFVQAIMDFIHESRKYYTLLRYAEVIRDGTNLGSLWFRETTLDMDKEMQYPVRSSLPFILAEHILGSVDNPALNDSVFFPFEIYNDAAYYALNMFQSQFLYRELEAELTLCVDMISVTFARAFFRFSREQAAGAELPPECAGIIKPTPVRYGLMVKQNTLQLLGSQVDFNLITTNLINGTFQAELEKYVREMSDLRAVPFYAHLFRVLRCAHSFLARCGLRLDSYDMIYKKAMSSVDPLCPYSALVNQLNFVLTPANWRYNTVSRRFLCKKDYQLAEVSNEQWALLYTKIHTQETKFIGAEHYAAIIEMLTETELTVFISHAISLLADELGTAITHYVEVAGVLRLLQPKNKDELAGYFNFISDAYSETKHPRLGALLNSLRICGNITALLYGLECEMKPCDSPNSLISSIVSIYRAHIEANRDLFVPNEFDYEKQLTHRTFPSLWAVLEFLLCSPHPVWLSETNSQKHPLETFGDGPVLCAHILILLAGQQGLYDYDSICNKALGLYNVQKPALKGELAEFVAFAAFANQSQNFAQVIVHPFRDAGAL